MNKQKQVAYGFLGLLVLLLGCVIQVESVQAEDDPMGFTVETIMPAEQIDKTQTYFYIKTEPGQTQKLKVKVTGTSDEPVKIKTYVANAFTAPNGTVNYLPEQSKDPTLSNSIEEIAAVQEKEFELKNKEEKIVEIDVTPPAEHYEGVKMGAIYFERVSTEAADEKAMINTKLSYRVGLIASESDGTYTDSQELNLVEVKPEIMQAQKTIGLVLQNPDPKTIADFYLDVSIVEEKTGKIVKTQKLKNGMMAPNSRFDFSVLWGLDPIPSGSYIAKVSAKSRYKSWELEKKFEITKEQAKKMNEETLYKLTLPAWAYYVTIGLGIGTVVMAGYLSVRGARWKKESQRKRKKIRKKKGSNEKRKKRPRELK